MATVTLSLDETADTDQYNLILLNEFKLAVEAKGVPDGGKVDAPGTEAPVATAGQATEPEPAQETKIALVRGDGASEELDA
jgi:hypothetical protein